MNSLFNCYSRLLIDSHISDLKPEYMQKFDPAEYFRMVRLSGVESAMVYACDHNGNCYYPTRCGHMHTGCAGRDCFGETVRLLKDGGVLPIAYYTVIYHNRSAVDHPSWRSCDINGMESHGRYHYSCPNNPEYAAFCQEQLAEILAYPVAGIFIDMTFWPQVCCCPACREKYGKPIPEIIDWNNPEWVRFQRWRESSLAEFAANLTGFIRNRRPEITVTHQFSPVLHGWLLGQSGGIAAASDYASGDFYGGTLQQRLGAKIFAAYSRKLPFEFMTSRCESLHDHTSTKSDNELFLHAATTLANGGAYFFIDAINPAGTLEEPFYRRLGAIVKRLEPFKRVIARHHPEPVAEIGLYFSMKSQIQMERNQLPLRHLREDSNNMGVRGSAMLDEIAGCAEILTGLHLPYRIIPDTDTEKLDHCRALIVNNAIFMTREEVANIRRFVEAGGVLIATGKTSLCNENGETTGNFQLADLLGVDYSGRDAGSVSYLVCDEPHEFLSSTGSAGPLVTSRAGTRLRGRVALPDFPPGDPIHYASIHSDPPGEVTDYAGWTEHPFGRGRAIYLYSGLLRHRQHSQREFGKHLFSLLPNDLLQTGNVHPAVETTLLRGRNGTLLLAAVTSFEPEPNPVLYDLSFRLRLPAGFEIGEIRRASDGGTHPGVLDGDILKLELKQLNTIEIFEITRREDKDEF